MCWAAEILPEAWNNKLCCCHPPIHYMHELSLIITGPDLWTWEPTAQYEAEKLPPDTEFRALSLLPSL